MKFYGMRELSNNTKKVIESLSFGNPTIITDKGKPKAILLKIDEDNFELILDSINRYIALQTLEAIQNESLKKYPNGVSQEEINEEVDRIRREINSDKHSNWYKCNSVIVS